MPCRPSPMGTPGRLMLPPAPCWWLGLGGCGTATTPGATGSPVARTPSSSALVPVGYMGRFRISATVLSSLQHGPQLCGGRRRLATAAVRWAGCEGLGLDPGSIHLPRRHHLATTCWVGTWDGASFTMTQTRPRRHRPRTPMPGRALISAARVTRRQAAGSPPNRPPRPARVEQVLAAGRPELRFRGRLGDPA